ncbi:hypothetical protein GTY80_30620, partial [Amycolatopsis sp. SID8362]|nr:hypothetical protein [Amycolatopsis sp. SID8362]NED44269.1 hypothetical protein [Amycolatopsis sp. SID8362]
VAPDSPSVRPLLSDPSPAVTRQVVAFLRGKPVEVGELLAEDRPLHTRRAAAAVLRGSNTWRRLHTDLALLRDDDLGDDADRDLRAWLAQSAAIFTTPAPELAAAIEGLLYRVPEETARRIRLTLPR